MFERGIEGRQSETLGTPGWTLFKLHAARKDATIFWGIVPLLVDSRVLSLSIQREYLQINIQ